MKLNKKYLKNCIIMIIAIAFIFRIGFSEQYILTVTNIWGKDILYEGKAVDEFYKQEKLKIYFYESKTKDKIGLISMRKGKFLFFNYYKSYQSMEVDYTKQIYVYKTNLSKGLDGKETYSLENIDRVIFNDVYTTNPQGWQYPPIIRHIYCGKINRADSELILEDIGEKDFLVKDINQESLYFFIDTIEEIKYDSLDVNTFH